MPAPSHRDMLVDMPHSSTPSGRVKLVGPPVKFSRTASAVTLAPPLLGEHTREVLSRLLGVQEEEIVRLVAAGVIEG